MTMPVAALLLATAFSPAPGSSIDRVEIGTSPGERVAADTVRLTNELKYAPAEITVAAGTTVVWVNSSVLVHTVTDDAAKATIDGSHALPAGAAPFDSGLLDAGDTFEHTFTVPGIYRYFCIPHEGARMWGTVVVRAPPG